MRLMIFILGLFLSSVSFAFSEADLVKQLQQPQTSLFKGIKQAN